MFRQLDQRTGDGLTVTLEWDSETDSVEVRCEDERSPDQAPLCYPVKPSDARQAFLHPFAYAESAIEGRRRWFRSRPKPRGRAEATDFQYPQWLF